MLIRILLFSYSYHHENQGEETYKPLGQCYRGHATIAGGSLDVARLAG